MGVKLIVVGVDGSANSRSAVLWTAALASKLGAEVVAVHALGLIDRLEPGAHPVPVEHFQKEILKRFGEDWCAPLSAVGVRNRQELVYGPPVEALLRTAEAEGADLIVVGSRGLGGVAGSLGSTSAQIAHRSERPVAIIPVPTRTGT